MGNSRPVRTRVAPSPTGEPHIGTMYAALFCKAFARGQGGRFIFRLEDTDRTRFVPAAVQMLPDALQWLGLDPDEGPNVGGPYGPYVQSERLPLYRQYAEDLIARGKGYYCFCTPAELEAERKAADQQRVPYRYSRRCLHRPPEETQQLLAERTPHTVRLRIPDDDSVTWDDAVRGTVTFETRVLTDQILLKSDGFPTSHLAIPLDDYLMQISHVFRGEEWLSSVPYYLLLYRAFGWEAPVFAHLSILRNNDKNRTKMSKRKNPTSVRLYRAEGYLPPALVNFLALLGWSHPEGKEIFSFEEFAATLTLERIVTSAPIFDLTKLEWMNGVYIRAMSLDDLADAVQPFLPEPVECDFLLRMLPLIQERMKKLNEVGPLTEFLRHDPDPGALPFAQVIKRQSAQEIAGALATLTQNWEPLGAPSAEQWDQAVRQLADQLGWRAGDLFMALRIAITGTNASPPTYEFAQVIGWPATYRRLHAAIGALGAGHLS